MSQNKKERLWCLYYKPEDRFLKGLTTLEVRAIATSLPHMEKIHWLVWKERWDVWRSLADVDELMEPLIRDVSGKMPKVTQQQDFDDLGDSDMNTLPTELTRPQDRPLAGERPSSEAETYAGVSARRHSDDSRRRRREDESRSRRRSDDSGERSRVERYNPSTVENLGDITMVEAVDLDEIDLEVLEADEDSSTRIKNFKARSFKRHRARMKVMVTGPTGQLFETYTEDVSVGGIRLCQSLPGWALGNIQVKLVNEMAKQAVEVTCHVISGQEVENRRRLTILPLKKKSEEVQFDKWLEAA
jgi:hypothetical protein